MDVLQLFSRAPRTDNESCPAELNRMRPAKTFKVVPDVPDRIGRLKDIAYNPWWSWNYECMELIRRVDRELWEATDHNPVKMLGMVSQVRLDKLSEDPGFLAHYDRVAAGFDEYMCEETWCQRRFGSEAEGVIAYFSAEFGITESLAIYSGGLGILAGDHLKSSSDLGLPLVGVGLLYQRGNFRQFLNYDGWQGEKYFLNDFFNMPVREAFDSEGRPMLVSLDFPGGIQGASGRARDHVRLENLEFRVDGDVPIKPGARGCS